MKRIIISITVMLFAVGIFAQENQDFVEINGVRWATRNVDEPGTFAETPESTGKFYQWNRKTAWNATGDVSAWDKTTPGGMEWSETNDPSPEGWRVPTADDINSLLDETKVYSEWTTENGVNGRRFTERESGNSLFLPAAGCRENTKGTLRAAGTLGNYWSSAPVGVSERFLTLDIGVASKGSYGNAYGRTIRPVED